MDIIDNIQKAIVEIYKTEKIEFLNGKDNNFILPNEKQLLSWNSEVINKMVEYQNKNDIEWNIYNFQFYKNLQNLLFNSDEVAYFTANAFLYKDKINNPIDDVQTHFDINQGKSIAIYPNLSNLASKRYSMFVAVAFEKIYNYWDRLGDLLWSTYFQNELKERSVDFVRVIDLINDKHPEYHNLESFKWLNNFKNNEYKEINKIRKDVVHYTSIDIEFKSKHLDKFENSEGKMQNILSDRNEIEKIMNERKRFTDFLKNEINNTIEGFIQIHYLIEEITNLKMNQIK